MATLGSQAVGSIVKLNVNGSARNFIVVHQGLPGSMYDASCDGTWLLMEGIYERRAYDTNGENLYSGSSIHEYLYNTFINLFDTNTKNIIKQVKIPYRNGTGQSTSVATGSNGLSTKIFLLSISEVDVVPEENSNYGYVAEGSALSYFKGADNLKRIAYFGHESPWLLRSSAITYGSATKTIGRIQSDGSCVLGANISYAKNGVRPALVLPTDTNVADDGTIVPDTRAITGSVNIGGVDRELTGKGYINIGGVLRELSDSRVNIGGTIKSLKG